MINRIFKLAFNELFITWKDKTSLVWMLVMPIFFIIFFGGMLGGGGSNDPSDTTIRLTVVDNDVTWISRAIIETLAGEDFDVQETTPGEAATLENRIRTLVIPQGTADAVARGDQVTLFLATEPGSNDSATQLAEVHVFRALTKVIGTLVEMQDIAGVAEPIDLQVDRVLEFRELSARPPLVNVARSYAGGGRPVPQGFGQAVPGMLTQFMVMIVIIVGTVYITQDKVNGVLRRLAVTPLTPRTLIAGKMTGMILIALAQAGILIAAGSIIGWFDLFGTDFYWGNSPMGLLLVVFSTAVATAGIGLFCGALLSTPAQAGAIGWLLGMAMASLGGCWWPLEVVPQWLQTVGHLFPTAWAMDALHELVSFGKGLDAVIPESLILLAYGTVFGLLGARFLKI